MRAALVTCPLEDIPVDFLADPDGRWEYDELALVAGFDEAWGRLSIGALTEPHAGFPEGAALVMLTTADHYSIALVDCIAETQGKLAETQEKLAESRAEPACRQVPDAVGDERVAA